MTAWYSLPFWRLCSLFDFHTLILPKNFVSRQQRREHKRSNALANDSERTAVQSSSERVAAAHVEAQTTYARMVPRAAHTG